MPAGTNGKCGYGAEGVDNLWFDSDPMGNAVPAGVNPIWHALNLQKGIAGDYAASYKVPTTLTGSYVHHFDPVTKNEWWWNASKKVFLSGDTTQAIGAKADYVADTGLGGVMIWELAGDYGYNSAKGQYEIGQSMVDLMHSKLSATTAYGATKANADRVMPVQAIDLSIDYTQFALGDSNYPINPKVVFTNRSTTDIPRGDDLLPVRDHRHGRDERLVGHEDGDDRAGAHGPQRRWAQGDFHTAQFTVPLGGIPAAGASRTS
ncbi:chitinase C-terminal domain-containing protein [Oerskovia sp. M15]